MVGNELPRAHFKIGRGVKRRVQQRSRRLRGKQHSARKKSGNHSFHWLILTSDIDYEHMSAEKRLLELGLTLPEPPAPGGNYVSAKTLGNLVYLSGVISTDTNGIIAGTAGADRTIPEGYAAARACALTQLAVLKRTLGSLDKVREIVSVNGYVNAIAGFPDSPAIINGASDLLIAVFQDQGRHVRAAVGVSALPRNALVEMQMIVAV